MASRSAEITLPFGDCDRTFRLTVGAWRKIQEVCDAGPTALAARLAPLVHARKAGIPVPRALAAGMLGSWRVDDVREVILQALIAGDANLSPTDAAKLVRENVDERPLLEAAPVAYAIIMESLLGPEDEDAAGEPQGETVPLRSPEAKSGSAKTVSTPKRERSAKRPEK